MVTMAQSNLNFIDGKWLPPHSKVYFDNINPADSRDVIGRFPESDQEDIEKAILAAEKAFDTWRLNPPPKKGEIFYRAGTLLQQQKERLARIMTREMGKVLVETRGDVQEAIDMAFFVAGEGRRLSGETTPSE